MKDPQIANMFPNLNVSVFDKQELLEITDLKKLQKNTFTEKETSVISVEKKVVVKNQMEKTQREYYLNEQLKAIQKSLVK